MTIHVHFATENNTIDYTRYAIQKLQNLADKPEQVNTTVHVLEQSLSRIDLNAMKQVKTIVVPERADKLRGSFGHAMAINHMLKMTGDGSIHVVMDSDSVTLARGWDTYVNETFKKKNIGCIGTRYEDVGGFSSGISKFQTYKGVPNFIWIALNPEHDWSDFDATPQKHIPVNITTEELSQIYGLPVGYQVLCDGAWKLPEYLHKHKFAYEGFRQIKPSSEESIILRGLNDYHEEYHVNGKPFVVHQRGSSKHAFRQGLSKGFYDAIDKYASDNLLRDD
jgi:hypothetical protein